MNWYHHKISPTQSISYTVDRFFKIGDRTVEQIMPIKASHFKRNCEPEYHVHPIDDYFVCQEAKDEHAKQLVDVVQELGLSMYHIHSTLDGRSCRPMEIFAENSELAEKQYDEQGHKYFVTTGVELVCEFVDLGVDKFKPRA